MPMLCASCALWRNVIKSPITSAATITLTLKENGMKEGSEARAATRLQDD
jgi:hypothetical protein